MPASAPGRPPYEEDRPPRQDAPRYPRRRNGAEGTPWKEFTTGSIPRVLDDVPVPVPEPIREPAPAPVPPPEPIHGEPVALGRRTRARAELRRQLRAVARLRVATLSLIVAVVLGAPVGFLAIRGATRDPVFADLDTMNLPKWASVRHQDEASGSRWCIRECRFRERTWESDRSPDQTAVAFEKALRGDGWIPWRAPGCPAEGIEGYDTCWQRDEYVLDLWVREPVCDAKPVRPTVGPVPSTPPSAPPSGQPPAATGPGCPGAIATAKVFNRIAFPAPPGG
jgi:integrin beta 3